MSRSGKSFARFVVVPENRSALLAVQELAACFAQRLDRAAPLLFLHGPPGTGKSHLVSALVKEVTRSGKWHGNLVATADLFRREPGESTEATPECGWRPHETDLLVLEDVQHLPPVAMEMLVQLLDERRAHGLPTVLTASTGPRHLGQVRERWPSRLISRLAGGLVVGLEPLRASSRQVLLAELAQRRQLAIDQDILAWLAENVSGGTRQLEGVMHQLAELTRLQGKPLDVAAVANHLRELLEASRPTVERVAREVGGYFRLKPRQLQSQGRQRNILLPRQIGMYLARQVTALSLGEIGAYFGGRDHSTVLHACRKVEQALQRDLVLAGAVRQIHADLT